MSTSTSACVAGQLPGSFRTAPMPDTRRPIGKTHRSVVLAAASLLATSCMHFGPVAAQTVTDHDRKGSGSVVARAAPNTESNHLHDSRANGQCAPQATNGLPFSITIDGQPLDGSSVNDMADSQRCTDLALARADIQVRFDAMQAEPRLNVMAAPDAVLRGEHVVFAVYANYALWIHRAEIRIFAKGDTIRQSPAWIAPVERGFARWSAPEGRSDEVTYVLRVYDGEGRFDETAPRILKLADLRAATTKPGDLEQVWGGNIREVRNIPVRGGAVTVSGRGLKPGERVAVLGAEPPVDSKGEFATQQIMPSGHHQVDVAVLNRNGVASEFTRSVLIPENDWFYVALADLTVGQNSATGPARLLQPDKAHEYEGKAFVNGRAAFYLKGVVKGEYLITAAADTREQPVAHLFTNFDAKDPRYLLRSLDPNRYYPVYGDDSTLVEDAPTRGKFYVRLDKGDNNVLWGNFKTTVTGTEFVRYERGLYGARAQVRTAASTHYGERRGQAEVFAAEPGTIAGRDVLRGTGGSSYYLRRQNVTRGSERVIVEVRDKETGIVLKTRSLVANQDYEINHLQGRLLLRTPLASIADDDFIVQSGSLSGHEQFLVVNYEYAPGVTRNTDDVVGGRASYWVTDHVEVGTTAYDQSGAGRNQKLYGADATLRWKPGTYVKAEAAQSNGIGDGEAISMDGGYTFVGRNSAGRTADAYRVEAGADLADILPGREGRLSAFWQHKDRDFSGPGQITAERSSTEAGARAVAKLDRNWSVRAKADDKQDEYRHYRAAEGNVVYTFDDYWKATLGVKLDDNDPRRPSLSRRLSQEGRRTDAALRLDYDSHRDWSVYVFGQATVDRSGERDRNDRVGVGGAVRVTEKLTAKGEVSTGTHGIGAKVGTEYKIDEHKTAYLNYAFDPDRTDILSRGAEGILVAGTRSRFSDNFSVYGEERARHGVYSGLTHAYGLEFVPAQHWKSGLAFEQGTLTNIDAGDVERLAVSSSLGYSHSGLVYSGKVEFRQDQTALSERDTWLTHSTLTRRMSPSWRLLAKLSASYSSASLGDFYDGDYVEGVAGAAYRPVDHDRLNVLAKYTFFYDLPSPVQTGSSGLLVGYAQLSHVLSVDATYDLNDWISIGGKYAFRIGELRDNRTGGEWFDSVAHLGIGRLDLKLIKGWDVIGELRLLDSDTAHDSKLGALVGVYRSIDENIRVGVGYNFTDYSDSITDLSYKNRGVFVNAIAKY